MILTLSIDKEVPGIYEVHYEMGGVEVSKPSQHSSISEALAYCGENIPADFAQFVDVHYGGVSSGTTAIARLLSEPKQIANELVALVAEVARVHEQVLHTQRPAAVITRMS